MEDGVRFQVASVRGVRTKGLGEKLEFEFVYRLREHDNNFQRLPATQKDPKVYFTWSSFPFT